MQDARPGQKILRAESVLIASARWHAACIGSSADRRVAQPVPRATAGAPIKERDMLTWTLIFLVVALLAGALGFSRVAGTATSIAKVLFVVFLILFLGSLIFGGLRGF
jgi:uncharacterized membrane protein YtjA (UPF0391 family)